MDNESLTNKEKLNRLVSLLAQNPFASREEQVAAVAARSEDVLRKTWYPKLESEGLAIVNPMLNPVTVSDTYQRFWIFIQTQYDERHDNEVVEGFGDAHRYQDWICQRLREVVSDSYASIMRMLAAEVLLGGGGWDIVLIVESQNERIIHEFVTQHVRTCPHVARSSTGWSQRSAPVEQSPTSE